MGEGLLTGGRITQRQLHPQKVHPVWMTVQESYIPGAHYTTSRQLDRQSLLSQVVLT